VIQAFREGIFASLNSLVWVMSVPITPYVLATLDVIIEEHGGKITHTQTIH